MKEKQTNMNQIVEESKYIIEQRIGMKSNNRTELNKGG